MGREGQGGTENPHANCLAARDTGLGKPKPDREQSSSKFTLSLATVDTWSGSVLSTGRRSSPTAERQHYHGPDAEGGRESAKKSAAGLQAPLDLLGSRQKAKLRRAVHMQKQLTERSYGRPEGDPDSGCGIEHGELT